MIPRFLRTPVRRISVNSQSLTGRLRQVDPTVCSLIDSERVRQKNSIVLIASENFTSQAVMDAVGSVLTNKYSEGYPAARYYGGNEWIDKIEMLCQQRALNLFNLDPNIWGVNVQALSGSPANFAVYSALVDPHERIMALDLPHGGHLSHGYQTDARKVSMVSKFWTSMPYRLDEATGLIDYEECAKLVLRFRPKLLICGASAYSRKIDFERFRKIADSVGAILMCDMAHIAGLVAAGEHPSPFAHVDVVTTTTHKTLRGPRGALIFFKKSSNLEKKINLALFPGLQGGPHQHTIAGIAVALGLAAKPEFRTYQQQVRANCEALARRLENAAGIKLVSGGSDNHLLLVDLRGCGASGSEVEKVSEAASLVLNKNTVPGDRSAVNPSGLRVGTPAMTSRGATEMDFDQIGGFLVKAIEITAKLVRSGNFKTNAEFAEFLAKNEVPEISQLKQQVEAFASRFEAIGAPPS